VAGDRQRITNLRLRRGAERVGLRYRPTPWLGDAHARRRRRDSLQTRPGGLAISYAHHCFVTRLPYWPGICTMVLEAHTLAGRRHDKGLAMKRLLAVIPLTLVSMAAWAVPFQGTYDVTVNTSGPGLRVDATPDNGDLYFDLDVGESVWEFLFTISTDENWVDSDDRVPVSANIEFQFTSPEAFGGTSYGDTEGVSIWGGAIQAGVLTWDNGGRNSLTFGNGGLLDIYLNDAVFGLGLGGLSRYAADVEGKFTYRRSPLAVPEPAILSLVGAGLLLMAYIRRRKSRQHSQQNHG
jgi:hypothetical protein